MTFLSVRIYGGIAILSTNGEKTQRQHLVICKITLFLCIFYVYVYLYIYFVLSSIPFGKL